MGEKKISEYGTSPHLPAVLHLQLELVHTFLAVNSVLAAIEGHSSSLVVLSLLLKNITPSIVSSREFPSNLVKHIILNSPPEINNNNHPCLTLEPSLAIALFFIVKIFAIHFLSYHSS